MMKYNYKVGDKVSFFVNCYTTFSNIQEEFDHVEEKTGTIKSVHVNLCMCEIESGDYVYKVSMNDIAPDFDFPELEFDNGYEQGVKDLATAIKTVMRNDEEYEATVSKIKLILKIVDNTHERNSQNEASHHNIYGCGRVD